MKFNICINFLTSSDCGETTECIHEEKLVKTQGRVSLFFLTKKSNLFAGDDLWLLDNQHSKQRTVPIAERRGRTCMFNQISCAAYNCAAELSGAQYIHGTENQVT